MPGPAIYVVAAVGTVAAGYAFKKFVYDPYLSTKVEGWLEEMKARRQARRNDRTRKRTAAAPHESFMHEDTTRLGRSFDGGRSVTSSHRDDTPSFELESLGKSSLRSGKSGSGSDNEVLLPVLASGMSRTESASTTASVTRRRVGGKPGGNVIESVKEETPSAERIAFPILTPTPSHATVSPPPPTSAPMQALARRTPSPQPSLSDSTNFSVGSSTIDSVTVSIETLRSPQSASAAISPSLDPVHVDTSPALQPQFSSTPRSPRSPRSPDSFRSLDSPQIQLPTPISPPRSPGQLFVSPSSTPASPTRVFAYESQSGSRTIRGLGLTTEPTQERALAPGLHAPMLSSTTMSTQSFNTALSEQDGHTTTFYSGNNTSASSSSQLFVDARSEASFVLDSDEDDNDFRGELPSPWPTNASGPTGPSLSQTMTMTHVPAHPRSGGARSDDYDIFSDVFSDGSWEEVAAQRDNRPTSPRR